MAEKPEKPKSFRDPVEPETRAERLLADCVLSGEIADVSGFEADEDKEVRAAFLRYLCLNAEQYEIDPCGIQLKGARVTGVLSLVSASLNRSLWFIECRFTDRLELTDAKGRSLGFFKCTLQGIEADRLSLEGDLSLRGATVNDETRLLGAKIGGQVDCDNATFNNIGRDVFIADGINVGGGISFDGATAVGETSLLGANVVGQVSCMKAIFINQGRKAFSADGLNVGGRISFEGATVVGETRLLGANIVGQISCVKAIFTKKSGKAFNAEHVEVGGSLIFQEVNVIGEVGLLGAKIGGQVACPGATFTHRGGNAFTADGLEIEGGFFFRELKAPVVGKMRLIHASIDSLIADGSGWPEEGFLNLDGFRYRTLGIYHPWTTLLGWIERQPSGEFTPQPYEQAIKVYRETGHLADAREMGIAKMEAYRKYGDLSPAERVWLWIAGPLIKYGYKPWRALYYALGVFALSVFVFAYAFDAGHMEPSKERVYLHDCYQLEKPAQSCVGWERPARWWVLASPYRLPVDYPAFNPITYSLDTIIPIVDLHQESYWLPRDTKPWGGVFRAWHWLHIGLGWMLTTLFVTGLTGIVKKD